jgi:hypothetical protein
MMWHMATCQNQLLPYGEALNNILKIGFIDVIALQTFGVATIYSASKTNTEKYSAQT